MPKGTLAHDPRIKQDGGYPKSRHHHDFLRHSRSRHAAGFHAHPLKGQACIPTIDGKLGIGVEGQKPQGDEGIRRRGNPQGREGEGCLVEATLPAPAGGSANRSKVVRSRPTAIGIKGLACHLNTPITCPPVEDGCGYGRSCGIGVPADIQGIPGVGRGQIQASVAGVIDQPHDRTAIFRRFLHKNIRPYSASDRTHRGRVRDRRGKDLGAPAAHPTLERLFDSCFRSVEGLGPFLYFIGDILVRGRPSDEGEGNGGGNGENEEGYEQDLSGLMGGWFHTVYPETLRVQGASSRQRKGTSIIFSGMVRRSWGL